MIESKVLVVIPARGGSVRVPKKNIKILNGKPLIAYAIEAAKNSKTVDRIIVSTDDGNIKDIAIKFGVEVPFRRPAHLSEDVPTEDVVIHAVEWLNKNEQYFPDIVVCLEPPAPFRKPEHIDKCVQSIVADKTIDSAITVNDVRGNRPEWMVYVDKDNLIRPYTDYFKKEGEALLRFPASQEFEKLYQSNGVVFACRVETLQKYKSLVGKKCAAVEIDYSEIFDLDYPEDFEICEILMKKRYVSGRNLVSQENEQRIWNAYNTLFLSDDTERVRKLLVRYNMFRQTLELPGDIIECGVFKGTGLFQWLKFLTIFAPESNKRVVGFDLFDNFEEGLQDWEKKEAERFVQEANYQGTDPDQLMEIARKMQQQHRLELIKGNACETIPRYAKENRGMRISLLHLDFDVYEPTLIALQTFWPLVVRGGIVLFDEYASRGFGESEAVDEFFEEKPVKIQKVPYSRKPSALLIKP